MIRLLIVEDQPAIRKGLAMRLAAEGDLSIVGEASTRESALRLTSELCPDAVLIDVDMFSMDGFEIAGSLRTVHPHSVPILLSVHDDILTRARAEMSGAAALVIKSLPADTLLRAIRQLFNQPDRTLP